MTETIEVLPLDEAVEALHEEFKAYWNEAGFDFKKTRRSDAYELMERTASLKVRLYILRVEVKLLLELSRITMINDSILKKFRISLAPSLLELSEEAHPELSKLFEEIRLDIEKLVQPDVLQ